MISQISTGRGMVRPRARGDFLEPDPSKDSAKEWDDKDHLAADFCDCHLFSELANRLIHYLRVSLRISPNHLLDLVNLFFMPNLLDWV
jgi:hypothetical protein